MRQALGPPCGGNRCSFLAAGDDADGDAPEGRVRSGDGLLCKPAPRGDVDGVLVNGLRCTTGAEDASCLSLSLSSDSARMSDEVGSS